MQCTTITDHRPLCEITICFICILQLSCIRVVHEDVIKWKHFRVTGPLCGEFTGPRWIPRTKASNAELWFFSLICVWINSWVNNREADDLRRNPAHYDVIVMVWPSLCWNWNILEVQSQYYNSWFPGSLSRQEVKNKNMLSVSWNKFSSSVVSCAQLDLD